MTRVFTGLTNLLLIVLYPAYSLWRAYINFSPDSFWWWCNVSFTLLLIVLFALELHENFKQVNNTANDLKYRTDV